MAQLYAQMRKRGPLSETPLRSFFEELATPRGVPVVLGLARDQGTLYSKLWQPPQ